MAIETRVTRAGAYVIGSDPAPDVRITRAGAYIIGSDPAPDVRVTRAGAYIIYPLQADYPESTSDSASTSDSHSVSVTEYVEPEESQEPQGEKLTEDHPAEAHADTLVDYLPEGKAMESKRISGSGIQRFMLGVAHSLKRLEASINRVSAQYDPRTTTDFISEWERQVGIPDQCFPIATTIEERRRNVITKIVARGVQTESEFIELASQMGFDVVITRNPVNKFNINVHISGAAAAVFPLTFPIPFGAEGVTALQCIFNKLKPVIAEVTFTYD